MRKLSLAIVAGTVFGAAAPDAVAIPAFARRYSVECHFCHDGYPKLNLVGQRFKERGFRMEREDAFDGNKWMESVPLTLRAQGNHTFNDGEDRDFAYLKGVAAGNLGKRVSFWVDDALLFEEDADSHIKPDNAWLRFEIAGKGRLYVRGGRLELDIPFTQTRTPHLFSYDIYFANTGFESDAIGAYQDGVELGGEAGGGFHWSAAVVKGRNSSQAERLTDDAGKFDANVFLRAAKRSDRNRYGAFAYIGRNTLAASRGRTWEDGLLRLGVDADVWLQKLNLYAAFIYGRNDNSLGTDRSLSYSGGFAQGDYRVNDQVVVTLRLNAVSKPPRDTPLPKETLTSLWPGLQFFPWERVKVSFEYGFHNKERSNFGAVQAEVAF